MIRVIVTEKVETFGNRRIYKPGEELIVHCVKAVLWKNHYMYRYRRDGKTYIDRIDKECVEVIEEEIYKNRY